MKRLPPLLVTSCTVVGLLFGPSPVLSAEPPPSFINWETAPVHPVALSPDGSLLAVCNLPDNRLELFSLRSGKPVSGGNVFVGLDPVSVRFRTADEAWVVNQISDSISVVDVKALNVVATINTLDAPADVVFAGTPGRAFVSCAQVNTVQVFDPATRHEVSEISIDGDRPKAMAVSPDGKEVFVAIFESGNASTVIGGYGGVVDAPEGPHGGKNPPPNNGAQFNPPINPRLPPPPHVSLIIKKNSAGRWMDDNNGDWTPFVSGANATMSGRAVGWDIPDRDLAIIDAASLAVRYATGLMNICTDVAVNPATRQATVIGTDTINETRYEPNLKGIFVRVKFAAVPPLDAAPAAVDLNPHLDYRTRNIAPAERRQSIGDPRGVVWNSAGTRGYVAGMGSGNLIVIDASGQRAGKQAALKLGAGSCALALDEARHQLYVLNRFDATLSVVDTESETVVATVPMFDPTPPMIKAGRRHFYDTHETSGLGQASCASCHVDGRADRLAWDLGNPAGELHRIAPTNFNFGLFPPVEAQDFHPMKGPMVTQTFQDIIAHEPLHWRGDRLNFEQFNGAFTSLLGADAELTAAGMKEFKDFVGTICYPPNPYRLFNNSLSTNIPLPGHFALGRDKLPAGAPLPSGDAQAGMMRFRQTNAANCSVCHTFPAGLGTGMRWTGTAWRDIPSGPAGELHVAMVASDVSSGLPFKIPQLRNMADKVGADFLNNTSRAGFGFGHDGRFDSLVRFIQDRFHYINDQQTADLIAFLLSVSGSDLPEGVITDRYRPPGLPSRDVPASVGKQITITNPAPAQLITDMINQAGVFSDRLDLIVKGQKDGVNRGWYYDRKRKLFQTDRQDETISAEELRRLAAPGNGLTYLLVPRGSGWRLGVDRDEDGLPDRTELEAGFDPADPASVPSQAGPRILRATVADNEIRLLWNSVPGRSYRVQFKNSLSDAAWIDFSAGVTADTASAEVTDLISSSNQGRYYRVQVLDGVQWPSSRDNLGPLAKAFLPSPQAARGH